MSVGCCPLSSQVPCWLSNLTVRFPGPLEKSYPSKCNCYVYVGEFTGSIWEEFFGKKKYEKQWKEAGFNLKYAPKQINAYFAVDFQHSFSIHLVGCYHNCLCFLGCQDVPGEEKLGNTLPKTPLNELIAYNVITWFIPTYKFFKRNTHIFWLRILYKNVEMSNKSI